MVVYEVATLGLVLMVAGFLLMTRINVLRACALPTLPWQVYRLAVDRPLRQNHALEHATLNVLAQRYGPLELRGNAVSAGFLLRGWIDPEQIAKAAYEGLARLQSGERELAYHPSCGTSIGSAELLVWLALGLAVVSTGRWTIPGLLFLLGLTWLAGPLLGRLVQTRMTVSAEVDDLVIAGITAKRLPASRRASPPRDSAFWGEALVITGRRGLLEPAAKRRAPEGSR